jgi:hypothetical protein
MIGIRLDLEGDGRGIFEMISRVLADGTEENHQNTLVKIFTDLAEIRNAAGYYVRLDVMNYEFRRMLRLRVLWYVLRQQPPNPVKSLMEVPQGPQSGPRLEPRTTALLKHILTARQ